MKAGLLTLLCAGMMSTAMAQTSQNATPQKVADKLTNAVDGSPQIHGTLRGKYEYQTQEDEGRFEVRTARISVNGDLTPVVKYKAEIDLCDEGQIKMLDAYARYLLNKECMFTIGQKRVPFTIDAHRSPAQQYFANRSFIAKQVGNVRDVGMEFGYRGNFGVPVVLEAGIFNGSGLTNQKDYWTKSVNYSAKMQFLLPIGLDVVLSTQKIKPSDVSVNMYDAGLSFHRNGFIAEVEYLYKHYSHNAFQDVNAIDAFVSYDVPVKCGNLKKISPLVRYDFMNNHSDGKRYDVTGQDSPQLKVTDYRRGRLTGGVTFSLAKPFVSDIRLNYEKYFYGHDAVVKTSEKDKLVVEFVTRF